MSSLLYIFFIELVYTLPMDLSTSLPLQGKGGWGIEVAPQGGEGVGLCLSRLMAIGELWHGVLIDPIELY